MTSRWCSPGFAISDTNRLSADQSQIILGIDPGLRRTGFGVIEQRGQKLQYLASGVIKSGSGELPERIGVIHAGICEVAQSYRPDVATIEKVFVNVNPQSTLLLGQARGAAIAALVYSGLPVHEYTALQLKQAVTGHGHADKQQIQAMVKRLLNLPAEPGSDAADALACAICHVNASGMTSRVRRSSGRNLRIRSGRLV